MQVIIVNKYIGSVQIYIFCKDLIELVLADWTNIIKNILNIKNIKKNIVPKLSVLKQQITHLISKQICGQMSKIGKLLLLQKKDKKSW